VEPGYWGERSASAASTIGRDAPARARQILILRCVAQCKATLSDRLGFAQELRSDQIMKAQAFERCLRRAKQLKLVQSVRVAEEPRQMLSAEFRLDEIRELNPCRRVARPIDEVRIEQSF
jgi:hypothetical protein